MCKISLRKDGKLYVPSTALKGEYSFVDAYINGVKIKLQFRTDKGDYSIRATKQDKGHILNFLPILKHLNIKVPQKSKKFNFESNSNVVMFSLNNSIN